jgi:NTP pyrophosphatase (non-canonical NTP hydrolase)
VNSKEEAAVALKKEEAMLNFDDYQMLALSTAVYQDVGTNLVYPALGLAGESGEYVDKVKKNWRNKGSMSAANLTPEERKEFIKELGDVLWYVAASARELGEDLSEVAVQNIAKLFDRRNRGVIKSEGDNR